MLACLGKPSNFCHHTLPDSIDKREGEIMRVRFSNETVNRLEKERRIAERLNTFEDLRSAVFKAFRKYMEDATKVISVMKKLRADAKLA